MIAWHEMDAKFEGFKQSGTVTVSADGKSELSFTMKKGPKHKKKK